MFKKNSMLSKYCWATGFLSIPISVALYFTNDPLSGIFVVKVLGEKANLLNKKQRLAILAS